MSGNEKHKNLNFDWSIKFLCLKHQIKHDNLEVWVKVSSTNLLILVLIKNNVNIILLGIVQVFIINHFNDLFLFLLSIFLLNWLFLGILVLLLGLIGWWSDVWLHVLWEELELNPLPSSLGWGFLVVG